MTTVMKVQWNMRFSTDVNSSISFEHLVQNEEDAKEMGEQDKKLFDAYMAGYGSEIND